MESEMGIKALAPWFGAKRTLARRIIAEFGPHNCYWEPMCGSCAVLLAKDPVGAETVNDLHGDLTHLAQCLTKRSAAQEVYADCYGAICAEKVWERSIDFLAKFPIEPGKLMPGRAAAYLVASWLARNGYGGTDDAHVSFATRFSATGGTTSGRWRSVVASIPAWHERLRNVTILNRDCFEVISRIDDAFGTVIYVDPPYLVEGNRYDHSFAESDHVQLAVLLARFRCARVIVSYYADPRLDDLYAGWTMVKFDAPKFLAKAGQREATGDCPSAPEVLFINGPSLNTAPSLFGDDQ